jgi:formamidopyrimidine-DNA glycosylase
MGIGISKTIPGNLGIEPLSNDFTLVRFRELLSRNQRSVIKPFLITQELVAGIGNAFADEILWEAQLYPKRKISSLSPKEIEKLHLAIRKVLQEAIPQIKREIKGGITGEIRSFLSIHGKDKKQCPRCQTKTATEKIGGRVSYFCPKCQKS